MKLSTSLSRCILLAVLSLVSILSIHAQSKNLNEETAVTTSEVPQLLPLEIELQLGLPTPWYDRVGCDKSTFPSLTLSYRCNCRTLPAATGFSVGFYYNRWYDYERAKEIHDYEFATAGTGTAGLLIGASGEWHFRRGSIFAPYAAATLGILWTGAGSTTYPLIQPNVGIELFHTFRIGLQTTLSYKDLSSYGLTFGINFGGYPRSSLKRLSSSLNLSD